MIGCVTVYTPMQTGIILPDVLTFNTCTGRTLTGILTRMSIKVSKKGRIMLTNQSEQGIINTFVMFDLRTISGLISTRCKRFPRTGSSRQSLDKLLFLYRIWIPEMPDTGLLFHFE